MKYLGFNPRLRKKYKGKRNKNPFYGVVIDRVDDIPRYFKEIGFKNPKHYTKWLLYKRLEYCPPYTTLKERKEILTSKKL